MVDQTLTTDRTYSFAVKPYIELFQPDADVVNDTPLLIYSGFVGGQRDMNLTYVDCADTIDESGTFNLIINDNENVVNKDHIRNAKVRIKLGKEGQILNTFIIGFGDIFDISRPATNFQEYKLSGFGTQIQASEMLMLVRKAADTDDDGDLLPEGQFNVDEQFQASLTERKFTPLNRDDIGNITGWDENPDIASDLDTNVPIINEVFTTFADYWDRLASMEGAHWFIDYSTGREKFTVKHPDKLHTGVTIKSGDQRLASDKANRTAYIKGGFNITEDSSSGAGVHTRLYTTTIIDREEIIKYLVDKGRTSLNKRFIAQQIPIFNDQRRITDITLILERIGEPESPKSRVNGFVVMDENDTPTGKTLGNFSVPISDLERDADKILIEGIDLKTRFLEGTNKIWIVLLDRSGIKGDVEDDPNNTVMWHHDNRLNQANTVVSNGQTIAVKSATFTPDDENDRDNFADQTWNVSSNGPTYSFKLMSSIRRLYSRTNPSAAKRMRFKEQFIDSSWLKNPKSVTRWLSLNLNPMSKPRRSISNVSVTIPNNFLFRPYQRVHVSDGLSGFADDMQIVNASYIISGLPGDPQYGTYHCDLTLSSSFNALTASCSCL